MTGEWPHSPWWHYQEADRLSAELAEVDPNVFGQPFVRAKVARANLHAQLAMFPDPMDVEYADVDLCCERATIIETRTTTGYVL